MKIRAVLFDLDGTLADTLADLAHATNWALAQVGCPAHPVESYRYMVGDGAGTSRGITGAWASGIRAAEGILRESNR